MSFGIVLAKEFISLFGFIMLFIFVVTNKKLERFDKRLYYSVIATGIFEIIVYEIEHYLSYLSYPTFIRVVLSALGYVLRPSLVVMIILLVDSRLRTRKRLLILLIPLAICVLCVSTAFYSHLCFWYNEINYFQRGVLGYVPHIICIFYTFICLIAACRLLKRRDKQEVLVLIFASLCPVFAIALDILVEDYGLSRISIMLCSLIMYIQSYSIAINKMIDEIPAAIAKFKVKNNVVKILSFNDLLRSLIGKSYLEFKTITKEDLFALFDEKSQVIIRRAFELMNEQDDYSFRFKTTLMGEEKHFSLSLKASNRSKQEYDIYATLVDVTTEAQIFEELSVRNDELLIMINHLDKIICVYDIPSKTLSMSEKYAKLRGYSSSKVIAPDETLQKQLISEEYKETYLNFYKNIYEGKPSDSVIAKFVDLEGNERFERSEYVIVATKDNKPIRAIITAEDITKVYQDKLLLDKYKSTLDGLMGDKNYCLLYDLSSKKVLAYEGKELPDNYSVDNKSLEEIVEFFLVRNIKEQDRQIIREMYNVDNMYYSYNSGVMQRHIELIAQMNDGTEHWFRFGVTLDLSRDNKILATLLCEDIDDEYRKYNVLIARANYDSLTGALTREATIDEIEKYLSNEGVNNNHALIMLDMDNLKAVNDNLGHQFGDEALKNFANTVKELINEDDVFGRIGGDEFFIFMKNITRTSLENRVEQLIHRLKATYKGNGHNIDVTASAGISIYYGNKLVKKTLNEMYSQADSALYKSKVNGKNTYYFFDK